MRLVDRQELMTLPEGTVYSTFEPYLLGELMVKGETIKDGDQNIAWYERPVGPYVTTKDYSFNLDDTEGREALFDEDRRYLVYSPDEIEMMIDKLRGVELRRSKHTEFDI